MKNIFQIFSIVSSLLLIFTTTDLYIRNKPKTNYNNYSEFLNEWRSPDVFPSQLPPSAENIKYKYDTINDFKCISFTLNDKDFNEYYSQKCEINEEQQEIFELCIKNYIIDYQKLNFDNYDFSTFDYTERNGIKAVLVNDVTNSVIILYSAFISAEH